ncbi:hypothetical protein X777_12994 [Ooceraea biroi]|uniref:Uncharacterized protein n=1 Tax=Ooceraea biroi TaxID=2015173 RepID=A0A026W046_OOCBI|nr:hypothetical protein X777_12994 [Ooceraea biroi]
MRFCRSLTRRRRSSSSKLLLRCSAARLWRNLFAFLYFHVHIPCEAKRHDKRQLLSRTHSHTRKKRTRANTPANKRIVTSAYKSIMNHRHVIFVVFGSSRNDMGSRVLY